MKISKFLPLIGIFIFLYLILNLNLLEIWKTLAGLNFYFYICGLIFTVFVILIKTAKWKVLISSYKLACPFAEAMKAWLVGFSLGLITPGKLGDLARSYYLKERIGKSLTTVIVDRIVDIFVLFTLCIIGLGTFAAFYVKDTSLLLLTVILFAVFLGIIFLFSRKEAVSFIMGPFYRRLIPEQHKTKIKGVYNDFYSGLELLLERKMLMFVNLVLTLFSWALTIFYVWIFALALGLNVPYGLLFTVIPIVNLLFILPISFSGLGTRDVTMVFFLAYAGIAPESAIALSLLMLITDYITGIPGFGLWYRNPIKINSRTL